MDVVLVGPEIPRCIPTVSGQAQVIFYWTENLVYYYYFFTPST